MAAYFNKDGKKGIAPGITCILNQAKVLPPAASGCLSLLYWPAYAREIEYSFDGGKRS